MITKGVIHQVESATVRDRDGVSVGKVVQVFPSDEDGSAAYLCVATGLLGRHQALVPADDATFDGTDVHVGYTKDAIKDAPSLGAGSTLSPRRGERRPQALRAVPHRRSDRRHG